MLPDSITRMRSASRMVDSRWAITKLVRPCAQGVHRVLDEDLGARVDRAGRLVQDEDRGPGEEGAGDGDELLLTRADVGPLVVDDGLVPVGQAVHEPVDVRRARRLEDLLLRRVRRRRTRCSPRSCRRTATRPATPCRVRAQVLAGHLRDVDAVECDPARGDLVEPHEEVDQRRLAGAGRADDGDGLAGLDRQRQVLDQRDVRAVAERDLLERHPPAHLLLAYGRDRVRRLLVGVQQREDALGRGDAGLEQVRHAGDLGDRLGELAGVLDERLHVAQRQRPRRHPQRRRPRPRGRSSGCR